MIELKKANSLKPAASQMLISFFQRHQEFDGHFYTGYPTIYADRENITFDGLWISEKYGVIIFDIVEGNQSLLECQPVQDKLYSALDSKLREYAELRKGRNLAVNLDVITFAPTCSEEGYNNSEIKIAFNR